MAQVDTGLGWSAKDEWLRTSSGLIANFSITGGPDFPNQPIPKAQTVQDVKAAGFKTYENINTSLYIRDVIVGSDSEHDVFAFVLSNYTNNLIVEYYICKEPGATIYRTSTRGSTISTSSLSSYDSTYDLYYTRIGNTWGNNPPAGTTVPLVSVFNTAEDGFEALQVVSEAVRKIEVGYAVCCIARWKTSTGSIIRTPVLISSDRNLADMETDAVVYSATLDGSRDGKRFYMTFYQNTEYSVTDYVAPEYDISGSDDPYANLDELFNLLCAPDQANIVVLEPDDPYNQFPSTDEDMGDPDPDQEDDEIEEADLPTMSFATAGFCRIYRPSFSQVSDLASYMWTDQNFLQTVINHLKQILENPIDAIISLSIVPCVPSVLADEEVKVMYVPTGVYMPPVQRQFVSVDCGTYTLKEMYGSALDYNPYTSVQLYLPYVGIVQLDTDEVMGKTLSIGYRIDVVTGVCCAYVKAGGDVLYQFSGHCSIHQPITSADFSGYINAALAAGKLVASIAAAGAGAPAVAATLAGAPTPSISGSESKTVETERNPNTGRQITVGTRKRESQTYNPGASFGEVATRGVSNTVGAVMNSKTIVQHSGGFSGNSGFMAAVRRPYLIVTRPRIANPEKYGKYNGRPSMIYLNLGDCTGFTQVQSIQLTGIDATNPELSEIATLLNSGVIL